MQNYDPQQDVIPAAPEPQRPVPGTAKAFSIVAFVCGICSLVTLLSASSSASPDSCSRPSRAAAPALTCRETARAASCPSSG